MKKQILFSIFYWLICNPSFGQHSFRDFSKNIYDQVKASEVERRPEQYHLTGKVRKVLESDSNGDSTILVFNAFGKLEMEERKSGKSNFHMNNEYLFDKKGDLEEVREFPDKRVKRQTVQLFRGGWMQKFESMDETSTDNFFSYMVSYADDHKKIRFDFTFPKRNPQYVYVKEHTYTLSLNAKGKVLTQQQLVKTSEGTYGNSMNFNYDSLGQKTTYSLMDFCAGSNSCLIINGQLAYDIWGNLIHHSQSDRTVRNSMWSYSFSKHYLYDATGCLLGMKEEDLSNDNIFQYEFKMPILPVQYRYEIDRKGNWIVKYKLDGKEREVVAKRKILYWE
jgi:hypothetical protein